MRPGVASSWVCLQSLTTFLDRVAVAVGVESSCQSGHADVQRVPAPQDGRSRFAAPHAVDELGAQAALTKLPIVRRHGARRLLVRPQREAISARVRRASPPGAAGFSWCGRPR